MIYNKTIFIIFLFFSNLSYSDNNNQLLLIKEPKTIDPFLVMDSYGKEKLISKTDGKILLLNFWATWCPPCIKEIPALLKLKQRYKNDLEIFFISVDFNFDKTVPKFLKKNNFEKLNVFNDQKLLISNKFKIKIMPTTIVIDKNFKKVSKVTGYVDWLSKDYLELIEKLL